MTPPTVMSVEKSTMLEPVVRVPTSSRPKSEHLTLLSGELDIRWQRSGE
jgi:hypothetical protein